MANVKSDISYTPLPTPTATAKLPAYVKGELSTLNTVIGKINTKFTTIDNTIAGLGGTTSPITGITGYPNIMPSYSLNFASSRQMDSSITYSRSSVGTYWNSAGYLKTALANTPRFDYDPLTGRSKGILIEEKRTNLLKYSEDFTNAAWNKTNLSIVSNDVLSPSGEKTADKLVENSVSSNHNINQSVTITPGKAHTISIFAKAGDRTSLMIGSWDGVNGVDIIFDLISLQITGSYPNLNVSSSIETYPNGWYRCIVTRDVKSTVTQPLAVYFYMKEYTYVGNGVGNMFMWGAQVEEGAFATSYIPTTSSKIERKADDLVVTNLPTWFNQDEGSIIVKCEFNDLKTNFGMIYGFTDGTSANYISTGKAGSTSPIVYSEISAGGTSQGGINNITNTTIHTPQFIATAYKTNDFVALGNGGTAATDTTVIIPTITKLNIGCRLSDYYINGHIAQFFYYPKRLLNSELITLTSY